MSFLSLWENLFITSFQRYIFKNRVIAMRHGQGLFSITIKKICLPIYKQGINKSITCGVARDTVKMFTFMYYYFHSSKCNDTMNQKIDYVIIYPENIHELATRYV